MTTRRKGKRNMMRKGPLEYKFKLCFNDLTIFLFSLLNMLQECWGNGSAFDQKGRQRIGQLSNGINLTTQQVQQASTERLPLDEHS